MVVGFARLAAWPAVHTVHAILRDGRLDFKVEGALRADFGDIAASRVCTPQASPAARSCAWTETESLNS